jgi:hypothetical protein
MRTLTTLPVLISFFSGMVAEGQLTQESQAKIKEFGGQIPQSSFVSEEIYVRAKCSLTGIQELITSNTKKIQGVSSTDQGKLDRAHRVNGVQITYATIAEAGAELNPGLVDYVADMPAALRSAMLIITQNGKVVQEQMVSSLIIQGDADVNDGYFIPLAFGLANTHKLEAVLHFPEGAPANADKHYISVKLRTDAFKG